MEASGDEGRGSNKIGVRGATSTATRTFDAVSHYAQTFVAHPQEAASETAKDSTAGVPSGPAVVHLLLFSLHAL